MTDRNYTPGLYYLIDRVAEDPDCDIYYTRTTVEVRWSKAPGGRTVYAADSQDTVTEVYAILVKARGKARA